MTGIAVEQPRRADAGHEHAWLTESSHRTSEGRVVYVHCARCGARRVDLQPHPPPRSLTRDLGEEDAGVDVQPESDDDPAAEC